MDQIVQALKSNCGGGVSMIRIFWGACIRNIIWIGKQVLNLLRVKSHGGKAQGVVCKNEAEVKCFGMVETRGATGVVSQ